MGLTDDLVAKFAKAVNAKNDTKNTSGTKLQGTIQFKDDKPYVKLDGSDILTPVQLTANVIENERVTVTIKDHMAIVDGNLSSPAARTDDLKDLKTQVQNIKDRRRSVYYQDEEPTDGSYEEGDIWFKTDAGNKMHYYKEGEWVEAQFDSDAIAPQAITTEKIDAKAVRAAQIDVKDLFAQDIEASGTIMGGKFVSIPVKCWGGFTYDDLELISKYVEDPLTNPLINTAVPYLDVNGDGVVDMTDYGLIQEWLNGNTTFIPDSYFDKTSIYECFIQFTIDTTDIDKSIRLVIFRSNCGLENIEVTSMGQTGISTPQLDAERANIGELETPLANIVSLCVSQILADPNTPTIPLLISRDVTVEGSVDISGTLYALGELEANGVINAKDGVNIPLLADNSGDTMVTTPTAGVINLSSTQGITDVISTYKSFIGSIYAKNVWYNLISVRHRNGVGDGAKYGMYIKSPLTSKGNLAWDQLAAGTWQGERTILDSYNYTNYVKPKIRGIAEQKYDASVWGTAGYVVLAKIWINGTYMSGANIVFTLTSFGDKERAESKIIVRPTNVGTASSTNVGEVATFGTPSIYYIVTQDTSANTATIELIAYKAAYEQFAITHVSTPGWFLDRASVSFPMTFESTLRSGAIAATPYTNLNSANYSNYAVPKTGGTFTGDVTFDGAIIGKNKYNVLRQDYYVFHTADGAGKSGYWKLCTITITGTYAGSVIEFDMTCRHGIGKLYVSFNGTTDISAYKVSIFKQTGGLRQCYAVKTSGTSSGSVFDIYVQKEEAYGNLTVTHIKYPIYMRDRMTLTWSGDYASSLPSGYTTAKVGNDWTSYGSATGTSTSVAINAYSSYLFTVYTTSGMEASFLVLANSSGGFSLKSLHTEGTLSASVSGTTLTISAGASTSINYKYIELK